MALVGFGGGVLAMSGSIGSQTFSHNRSGPYVRRRAIPVNPNTNRQSAVRAANAALASQWSNVLSQPQRDAWEVYAANIVRTNKLGAQIFLTGFNHFLRSNVEAVVHGLAVPLDAPTDLSLPAQDPSAAAVIDEAGQELSITFNTFLFWASQDDGSLLVYMSLPHTQGTNFIGGPYRFAGEVTGVAPGPAVSPAVITVPFPVAANQAVKVAFRIREEDGRLTDRFFHQSSVVA